MSVHFPSETHSLLKRAAEIKGQTIEDFVVSAAREAAARVIEQVDVLRLPAIDQGLLAEAILASPAPNRALVRATKRRHQLLG